MKKRSKKTAKSTQYFFHFKKEGRKEKKREKRTETEQQPPFKGKVFFLNHTRTKKGEEGRTTNQKKTSELLLPSTTSLQLFKIIRIF